MPRRHLVGDQWDTCDRCGILTPSGKMHIDKGLKLCDRSMCNDKVDDEVHLKEMSRILAAPTQEGADRRSEMYFAQEDWDGHD